MTQTKKRPKVSNIVDIGYFEYLKKIYISAGLLNFQTRIHDKMITFINIIVNFFFYPLFSVYGSRDRPF